jgi:hypothetical protein
MKQTIFLFAAMLLCSIQSYTQKVVIGKGVYVVCGAHVVANCDSLVNRGTLNNTGTGAIELTGNLMNTGNFTNQKGSVVTFDGITAQILEGTNQAIFSTLNINNSAGLTLAKDAAVNGNLNFQNGIITTGTHLLTIGDTGTITNATATKYVNGKLANTFSNIGTKAFPIGKGGNYRPVTLQFSALTGTSLVIAEQFETGLTGTLPADVTLMSTNRSWEITQTGGSDLQYFVTLDATGYTPERPVVILKEDAGLITAHEATTPDYTNTAALSTFSNFGLGEACVNPVNGGTASADQNSCLPFQPGELTCTVPTGHTGTLLYQWQKSVSGSNSGFENINGAVNAFYSPGEISETTWFRRLSRVDCKEDWTGAAESSVVQITIYNDFTPGTISSTGETICYSGDPVEIGSTTPASGGDEAIEYKWQANGSDISNSNSATFDPPAGLTETTTYTRWAKDGECNASFTQSTGSWTVTVYDEFTPGTISSTGETICYSGDPVEIGSTTPASGGDGSIEYKWHANGSDISNSNSTTYDPPAGLTETTTYTRWAKDGTCNSFEESPGIWTVTVRDNFTPGTISSTGETICYSGDPVEIGSTTAASGGDEAIEYKWQANGSDISNSNSVTYDPTAGLAETTTYTRWAKDGTCNSFEESPGSWTVTVYDEFTLGTISSTGETICYSGDPVEIGSTTAASGGDEAIEYKWQANGSDISNSNSVTYDPPAGLTETTTYTRWAKDGTCNMAFEQSSGEWTVIIEPYLTPEVSIVQTVGTNPCCPGDVVTFEATPVNGGANPSYQWYVNGLPAGTNAPVFNHDPENGDEISVVMTTSVLCPTVANATSNSITMQEISPATVLVSMRAAKGTGREVIFTAYPINGGANPVYKWYKNNVMVQEGSSPVLTSECTAGDEHYVELYSSLPCGIMATSLVYCSY